MTEIRIHKVEEVPTTVVNESHVHFGRSETQRMLAKVT